LLDAKESGQEAGIIHFKVFLMNIGKIGHPTITSFGRKESILKVKFNTSIFFDTDLDRDLSIK